MPEQTKTVSLYNLSTCPWSRKSKAFLDDRRVKYSYIDYDLVEKDVQDHIQNEMVAHNAAAFPFARIAEDFVVGYNPEAYARLLGLE
ncbi:MAG TPA: glutaredoxin domain-containing protein [Thermoleophilia bacterium]|nr:glutaredoxin domain-containing protein [Thermoleophilia bacterium]